MKKTKDTARYYLELYKEANYHVGKFGKIISGCVFAGDLLRIWKDRKRGFMFQFKGQQEKAFEL